MTGGRQPGGYRAGTAAEWQTRFLDATLAMDEEQAVALVHLALDSGLDPESVLLDVIARTQILVGAQWAAARLTVAREHAATAISARALAALAQRTATPVTRGRVTVACVEGEWHALPARLVAETLRLRGWHVDYLGNHLPTAHLISHLHATGPDAVALSCSLPTRLPAAHACITACRTAGVPVLVGGAGFGKDDRHARLLGADVWAAGAVDAALRLEQHVFPLPAGRGTADPPAPYRPGGDYLRVSGSRPALISAAVPAPDARPQPAREDIAHLVDFLIAALYVDDAELLTDHLAWAAEILEARGVPGHTLLTALDVISGRLSARPGAVRLIRAARAGLTGSVRSSRRAAK